MHSLWRTRSELRAPITTGRPACFPYLGRIARKYVWGISRLAQWSAVERFQLSTQAGTISIVFRCPRSTWICRYRFPLSTQNLFYFRYDERSRRWDERGGASPDDAEIPDSCKSLITMQRVRIGPLLIGCLDWPVTYYAVHVVRRLAGKPACSSAISSRG
jgi:hypothetical protein